MELKNYKQQPFSSNPGMLVLNNPLEGNQMSSQKNYINDPLSSNFSRTNTYLPQSSFNLNNPLMSKNPLQSNNVYNNKNINVPSSNTNTNINLNMINLSANNMNTNMFNQNLNQKQNMKFYTIKVDNEKYNLSIECNNILFIFKLEPANNIIVSYYKGEFNLSTIINKLNAVINNQNAFEQLNKIIEKAINNDNIRVRNDKQNKKMIIRFNKNINDHSSEFELLEVSNNKKLFNNIFEELNLLKFQQVQYMTLFKNNNFISSKDAINLINENNSKNDFENKIKNIDSICNSQKNEINNLKNEINNTKNELENKIKNSDLNDNNNKNKANSENITEKSDINELKNEISNIKNDFKDKIEQINFNEIKSQINQVKTDFEDKLKKININLNEINTIKNDTKSENNNNDFSELKNQINNVKENFENKFKSINLNDLEDQISNVKDDVMNKFKNINLDGVKNEINNIKLDFDNKIKNINLGEIKQEISNAKDDFDNKLKNINIEELKKELTNLKDTFENSIKSINLNEIKTEIKTNKDDFESKLKSINLEEIKNEVNNIKSDIGTKIKNININSDELKNEIINLKNNIETKIQNLNIGDLQKEISNFKSDLETNNKNTILLTNSNKEDISNLKNEINNMKLDLDNKINIINSSENNNKNEFDDLKKEISNLKNDILEFKEKQNNLDNENNELKKQIILIKETQINKENELKNEIKEIKDENQKLILENEKLKQEMQNQINIKEKETEDKNNNKINEENNQKLNEENTNKIFNEISLINKNKDNIEKEIIQLKTQLSKMVEKENKKEEEMLKINQKKEKMFKEQVNHNFKESPDKLKNKFDILNTNNIYFIDEFAVYISIKDKQEYLASGNKDNFNIDIYNIKNNVFFVSLKAHNNGTPTVRYFLDEKKNKEYLISADFLKTVIVWDINNDYNILLNINNTNYKGSILSTILLFNIKIKEEEYRDYLITSSDDENEDFSKIYSFKDGAFIRNISNTNKNVTYYLLLWEYNNNYYIIEFCLNRISINNLLKDENYAELIAAPESSHFGGFIYNDKFLCCSSENGQIRIWDLAQKVLAKKIEMKGSCFFEIIPWNEKYVIAANYKHNSFDIFDIEKGELYKQVKTSHNVGIRAVKKIFLPNYGECLITSGHDSVIKLWSI